MSWHGSFVGKKRNKAWKVAPLCIFWALWRERNKRVFDNYESTIQAIKFFFYIYFGIGLDCTITVDLYHC